MYLDENLYIIFLDVFFSFFLGSLPRKNKDGIIYIKEMAIGLSNGPKRTKYGSTVNQSTGGGNTKAGLPKQIGRESYTSVIMRTTNPLGSCCTLSNYMTMGFTPSGRVYRNVGGNVTVAQGKLSPP
jgi:hypothetical protein